MPAVTSWRQAIAAHGSPLNLPGLAVGQSSATHWLLAAYPEWIGIFWGSALWCPVE